MKDARVDEIFDVIGDQMLVYIPSQAMDSYEWYKKNMEYSQKAGGELQTRSKTAEEAVIELINKFIEEIKEENIDQEEKFKWIDINKLKPVLAIKPRRQIVEDNGDLIIITY